MEEEIKELPKEIKEAFTCIDYELSVCNNELPKILDYITNLQEELEDLRESDWAWHQILKAQNKREYRSKFLKEFQQEYNTNTFPDYDEIYKRYDKLKKENERLKEINKEQANHLISKDNLSYEDYKSRNEKAIEDINKFISGHYIEGKGDITVNYLVPNPCCEDRLNIIKKDLLGGDNENIN